MAKETPVPNIEPLDRDKLRDEYYSLCEYRDAVYKKSEPLENELTKVNQEIEKLRVIQEQLTKQIELTWGANWLLVKKKIADIVRFFGGRVPPKPETK